MTGKTHLSLLWPCDRDRVAISCTWAQHLQRPGYKREYAGVDLAGPEQPLRASQDGGTVLQAMWSNSGYGYTTFVEYGGVLRIRNAHQKTLNVERGQKVQAGDFLGIMDSTGNSTGTHTHFETWLKFSDGWRNIDPLDPAFGLSLVNRIDALRPLPDTPENILPKPGFTLPDIFPILTPKVKTTDSVTAYINLRSAPWVNSKDLGNVNPGEIWQCVDYDIDQQGNIWLAIFKSPAFGWAAAYYNGQTWLEFIES